MDYNTLVINPLRDMLMRVVDYIPTLFTALAILIVGLILTRVFTKLVVKLMRTIEFDKFASKVNLDKTLKTGGIKSKPSNLVGCIAYWTLMVMVLILTVKALGLPFSAEAHLNKIFAYVPSVILGSITLIFGMLIAKVVSLVIYITAKNTDMPMPEGLRDLSKFAIVIYAAIIFLKEIGFLPLFEGLHYSIFLGGIIFAMALAFGLAGKEVAARYLTVLKK